MFIFTYNVCILQYFCFNSSNCCVKGPIAPTDARYRPDLRHFDNGDLDVATEEKHRLEEKQREKRYKNAQFESNWKPLWFNKSAHAAVPEHETFTFNHKYWKRDFKSSPELY